MLERVVGEPAVDPDPHLRPRRVHRVGLEAVAGAAQPAHVHGRPLLAEPVVGAALLHQVDQVEAVLRRLDLRHHVLVLEAFLGPLEVERLVVDRASVLAGEHPAGGEGLAVPDPLDVVDDRDVVVAGQQEVGVQRVHVEVRADRAGRGDERLRGDLAAVDPLPHALGLLAAVEVGVELLEVQQRHQLAGRVAPLGLSRGVLIRLLRSRRVVRDRPGTARTAGRSPPRSGAAGPRRAGWSRSPRRARTRRTAARAPRPRR